MAGLNRGTMPRTPFHAGNVEPREYTITTPEIETTPNTGSEDLLSQYSLARGEPKATPESVVDELDQFMGIARVDTSSTSAFKKSFAEAREFTESAGDYLTRKFPNAKIPFFDVELGGRLMFTDPETGEYTLPYYVSMAEYLGDDVTELNEDELRERINEKRVEETNKHYGNVATTGKVLSSGAGTILGYMVDPSTAIPMGNTYKSVTAVGAGLGAADVAMEQAARDGEVLIEDVLIGAAVGGSLARVVKYAGDNFLPWFKDKVSKGEPLTEEDVLSHIDSPKDLDPNEVIDLVNNVNSQLRLEYKGAAKTALQSAEELTSDTFEVSGKKSTARSVTTAPLEGEVLPPMEQLDHIKEALNNIIEGSFEEVKDLPGKRKNLPSVQKMLEERRSLEDMIFEARKVLADEQPNLTHDEFMSIVYQDAKQRARMRGDVFMSENQARALTKEALKDAKKKPTTRSVTDTAIEADAETGYLTKAVKEEQQTVNSFRNITNKNKQSGEAASWFMKDIAASAAGGLYGYGSSGGDLESAAMWAIGAGALAHGTGKIGPKLYNKIGKLNPYLNTAPTEEMVDRWGRHYMAYEWLQRPSEYFRNVAGSTGHKFTNLLKFMDADVRMAVAGDVVDVRKLLHKLKIGKGTQGYEQVTALLRNPKLAGKYSKEVQQAASVVREKLNKIVKDAVGRGVIKAEVGQKMIKDALEKGYFPRIYDRYFLMSKEGKQKWAEVLGNHHWTKEEILTASANVLGEKRVNFNRFKLISSKKDGTPLYTVDKEFIKALHAKNATETYSNRSTHLDKARKINLPDKVMEPFLINDLEDVLTSYFQDTQRRIQSAKYFGNADQGMHQIAEEMTDMGLNPREIKAAWEMYWSSVGDPKSANIKRMMELPERTRAFYSNWAALETAKLMFAQTLNLTQATANSLIYLPSRVGSSTPKVILKGIADTFKKNNREWGERSGAAFEATVLEVAGEMGSLSSQTATKFLKYTGFTAVERIQRQLAANIGKAYAEEIIEKKAKLLAMKKSKGWGTKHEAEYSRLNDSLLELGINPDIPGNAIPLDQMARAGQVFSNTVNFINTPDKLPLAYQNPHAKLFRQFKTFMYHQGAFLHDNLVKPLLSRGDIRPIMGLAAAGGLGMAPSEVRKMLKGDDENYTKTQRYLDGFGAVGALGLVYDLAKQSVHSEGRFATALLGPFYTDLVKLGGGIGRSVASGSIDPLAKTALNMPLIGQAADLSGIVQQVGNKTDIDFLQEFPTRKDMKENFSSSSRSSNPYSLYKNNYPNLY